MDKAPEDIAKNIVEVPRFQIWDKNLQEIFGPVDITDFIEKNVDNWLNDFTVDNLVFMNSLFLYDIQNEEIFENDLLEIEFEESFNDQESKHFVPEKGIVGIVKYDIDLARYEVRVLNHEYLCSVEFGHHGQKFKKIGNMYSDQDLVEKYKI